MRVLDLVDNVGHLELHEVWVGLQRVFVDAQDLGLGCRVLGF